MAYRQYLLNEDTDNDSGKVRMRSLNGTSEKRVEPPHLFFAFAELPRALLEFWYAVCQFPLAPLARKYIPAPLPYCGPAKYSALSLHLK